MSFALLNFGSYSCPSKLSAVDVYGTLYVFSYPSWRLLTIDVYEILLLNTVVDFLGNLCIPVSQILPPPQYIWARAKSPCFHRYTTSAQVSTALYCQSKLACLNKMGEIYIWFSRQYIAASLVIYTRWCKLACCQELMRNKAATESSHGLCCKHVVIIS